MKKMMYQTKGKKTLTKKSKKPTQVQFDAMTRLEKEALQDKYGDYRISADTPTLAELQAAEKKQQEINKKKLKGKEKKMGGMYKEGGIKKSTASEFLEPPSAYNLDS